MEEEDEEDTETPSHKKEGTKLSALDFMGVDSEESFPLGFVESRTIIKQASRR